MKTLFDTLPRLSIIFSDSIIGRCTLFLQFTFFLFSKKLFGIKNEFKFPIVYNGVSFSIFLTETVDLFSLKEVFLDGTYEWFPIDDPKYIIDLGSNFGDTALYYHGHFPNATIIAVEPSPEIFLRLEKNTKSIAEIFAINAAIGETDGTVELNLVSNSLGHSITKRDKIKETVTVVQKTLGTLLLEFNIDKADIIKFDIEGAEFPLFANQTPSNYGRFYVGEVHADLAKVSLDQFESFFKDSFTTKKRIIPGKNRMIFFASES